MGIESCGSSRSGPPTILGLRSRSPAPGGAVKLAARAFRSAVHRARVNAMIPSPFLQEIIGDGKGGITVSGRGFGHGVGMCQMGAAEMARRGQSTEQILRHYYPGSSWSRRRGSRKRRFVEPAPVPNPRARHGFARPRREDRDGARHRRNATIHAGRHAREREGVFPRDLREMGASVILGNAFHLSLRPGPRRSRRSAVSTE